MRKPPFPPYPLEKLSQTEEVHDLESGADKALTVNATLEHFVWEDLEDRKDEEPHPQRHPKAQASNE
ncbi:hypothetical protein Pdw03_4901 [Penicillium digitatum]|uniref:Uncharacterized protein n=1 Tax=Penicillium digitatum TaxID=36651 RepID=A0A7T6XJ54_PENDI|nr:hypothetical protein Pdw03_4901 [Penicillium digitatum]